MNDLLIQEQQIAGKIHQLRGEKVLLDKDIAELYGVETRVLKQAVKRNIDRFPLDFMFILDDFEIEVMVSQSVIPSRSYFGGAKPMAFTEQGVAMLSGILSSPRAIQVNIAIMRTFVQLRKWMEQNKDLATKIQSLEDKYDEQFRVVFDAIRQLIIQEDKPRVKVGFKANQ